MRLHLAAVVRVLDGAVAGELVAEQAGLAAAHRVRLAGERERAGADLADLPREKVEVDEGVVLPHAHRALIQPHAVEAKQAARPAEKLSNFPQVAQPDPGDRA